MIRQGHSFNDLKTYTLGQLGVFIKAAVKDKINTSREQLWLDWVAAHASDEGITQATDAMGIPDETGNIPLQETDEEILQNWQDMASFFEDIS